MKKYIHPYCNHMSSVAKTSFFRPKKVGFSNSKLGWAADTNLIINWLRPNPQATYILIRILLPSKASVYLPNTMKKSKNCSQLMRMTYLDFFFHSTLFSQSFCDFSSMVTQFCMRSLFEQDIIKNCCVCSQYREIAANTVP